MNAQRSKLLLRGALASALALALAMCPILLGSGPAAAAQSGSSGHHLKVSGDILTGELTLPAAARLRHAGVRIVLTDDRRAIILATVRVPAGSAARRPLSFRAKLPAGLRPGRFPVKLCISRRVRRHTVTTCSVLGTVQITAPVTRPGGTGTTTSPTDTTPTSTTKSTATPTPVTTSTTFTPTSTTTSTPTSTTTSTPSTTTTTPAGPTPDGPTSPVWPVTTTATNYSGSCSYPEITTVPAPPPQTPTDPQTVTPNETVANPDDAPFFPDGLGQYECTANTVNSSADYSGGGWFTSGFYVNVPSTYTVNTPETLVVQMHGCYATASSDIYNLSVNRHTYGAQDNPYIMISLSGPEGLNAAPTCWTQPDDDFKVLRDIYLAETYFNINRHRIILLGYSSGGDLGYSTIFHYADEFAGILGQNTNPWSQNDLWTGDETSTAQKAISMAAWPFNVLQVATSGDTVYPYMAAGGDPGVEPVITTMQQAGFPAKLIETPGTHGQDDICDPQAADGGDCTNPSDYAVCTATSYDLCYGSYYDEVDYLLATVADDGWESP